MANTLTHADLQNAGNSYPLGLRFTAFAGANADTNITVTGITTADKPIFAIRFDRTSAGATLLTADITSEVVITATDTIQFTDTDTTGDKVLLCWYDKIGGTGPLTALDLVNSGNSFHKALRFSAVAGAGANTNIAITNIATTDKLLLCLRLNRDATAANVDWLNDTANCSITSAGNIQSTTNTTGDALFVIWYDKNGGTPLLKDADLVNASNPFPVGLKFAVLSGAAPDTNIAVTNIATTDKIMYAMQFVFDPAAVTTDGSAANFATVTSEVAITSAGNIQLSDTDTTGSQILLVWYDKA